MRSVLRTGGRRCGRGGHSAPAVDGPLHERSVAEDIQRTLSLAMVVKQLEHGGQLRDGARAGLRRPQATSSGEDQAAKDTVAALVGEFG